MYPLNMFGSHSDLVPDKCLLSEHTSLKIKSTWHISYLQQVKWIFKSTVYTPLNIYIPYIFQ